MAKKWGLKCICYVWLKKLFSLDKPMFFLLFLKTKALFSFLFKQRRDLQFIYVYKDIKDNLGQLACKSSIPIGMPEAGLK